MNSRHILSTVTWNRNCILSWACMSKKKWNGISATALIAILAEIHGNCWIYVICWLIWGWSHRSYWLLSDSRSGDIQVVTLPFPEYKETLQTTLGRIFPNCWASAHLNCFNIRIDYLPPIHSLTFPKLFQRAFWRVATSRVIRNRHHILEDR